LLALIVSLSIYLFNNAYSSVPKQIVKDKFDFIKTDSLTLVKYEYDKGDDYGGLFAAKFRIEAKYVDKLEEDLTTYSYKRVSDSFARGLPWDFQEVVQK